MNTKPAQILALLAVAILSACSTSRTGAPDGNAGSSVEDPTDRVRREVDMNRRADAYAHYATGLIHEMNGRPDEAFEELVLSVESDPANTQLVLQVARRLLESERASEARKLLAEAVEFTPDVPDLHAYLGMAYAALSRNRPAVESNRRAITIAPTHLQAYQNLIHLAFQREDQSRILELIDEASAAPGINARFRLDLADVALRYGQWAQIPFTTIRPKIAKLLAAAEAENPDDPRDMMRLGDGYARLQDAEHALEIYQKVKSRFAEWPQLREKQIAMLGQLGRTEEAEAIVDEMIRIEPANPAGYLFKAGMLEDKGDIAGAAEQVDKTIRLDPRHEPSYYTLIGLYLRLGDTAKAHEVLDRARLRFEHGFALEFYTGIAHVEEKEYAKAIGHFQAAERLGRETDLNAFFYFQLGTACERDKQYDLCETYLRKAISLQSDFPEALNYLAYTFAEIGRNLDEAEEMVKQALGSEPDSAAYLDTLAWIYFKQERFEMALVEMLKAVEVSEEPDAVMFDHLGDIYSALGRTREAIESWKRSIDIEPNEKIEAKLNPLES